MRSNMFALASFLFATACAGSIIDDGPAVPPGDDDPGDSPGSGILDENTVSDPLSPQLGFKTGQAQHAALCARNLGDAVATALCATATQPPITSLIELQQLLGLAFQDGNVDNGRNGNPAFALTGHSTSLVTRFTSAINPRVIVFTPPSSTGRVNNPRPLPSFTAMGFVRGEQFVELVSNDPTANGGAGGLNFFLVRFAQACNVKPGGCTADDLLTPKVESGFTGYSVYGEADLANTVFDCQQCHQPAAAGPKMLRMQELQNPWGHFFRNNRSNGQALLADFGAAHPVAETYGGIPGAAITNSDPAQLEGLVENQGFKAQPNEFNTNQLLDQGSSAGWMTLFTQALTGQTIPAPYHENRVTDPAKLASATAAYQASTTGTPLTMDIREVFAEAALPELQFRPAASLVSAGDGRGILVQMCQQCHNPALDQTLSRAKFDVTKLDAMPRAEKDKAIQRLSLPVESSRKMPPPRFRELSAAEIALVVSELQK